MLSPVPTLVLSARVERFRLTDLSLPVGGEDYSLQKHQNLILVTGHTSAAARLLSY